MAQTAITLVQLGAVHWINHNHEQYGRFSAHAGVIADKDARAKIQGLDELDFLESTSHIDVLCQKTSVNRTTLEQFGQQAAAGQFETRSLERRVQLFPDSTDPAFILRSIGPSWDALDGTMPQFPTSDPFVRYDSGPKWNKNSCWLDNIIWAAIQLDVGRICQDQIRPTDRQKLWPVSKMFRDVIAFSNWAEIDQDAKSALRDEIRSVLADQYAEYMENDVTSEPCALDLGFDLLMRDLPQNSYTWIQGEQCCDGRLLFAPETTPRREWSLRLGFAESKEGESLADHLNRRLIQPVKYNTTCSRGDNCDGNGHRYRVVLDRLPPTLIINLVGVDSIGLDMSIWKPFDDLTIRHKSIHDDEDVIVRYAAVGTTIHDRERNHYITRWKSKLDPALIRTFDNVGSRRSFVTAVTGTLPLRLTRGQTVVAIFFRMI